MIAVYPHQTSDFTQGLISEGNYIYESCGLYGYSYLKKYELKTGKLLNICELASHFFAEGIALQNDRLIQLTWKEKTALIYDIKTFEIIKKIPYTGEGWGLCSDKDSIWMSNGTSRLVKRDPQTFEIQRILKVKSGSRPLGLLNDLTCVGNEIYANVFGSDTILRIDKESGEVTGKIDASHLLTERQKKKLPHEAVLNGIAYREENQTFLITGKFWPHIFEVIFDRISK